MIKRQYFMSMTKNRKVGRFEPIGTASIIYTHSSLFPQPEKAYTALHEFLSEGLGVKEDECTHVVAFNRA